jgi:hypothetical protein
LADITNNLRLTGEVGTSAGEEYDYARKLKEDIDKAERAHFKITGTTQ